MRLALGTAQFGLAYGIANQAGRTGTDAAGRIMSEARRSGMDMLDTAIAYGESERVLGKIGIADWHVISKLPPLPETCVDVAGWVEEQVKGSLARLGVRQLYAILLHRPGQLFDARGRQLFDALEGIKRQGYVSKIGVSSYAPDELKRLFDHFPFDLVQAPLNILDRRLVESGWAQCLQRLGVELHTRSAFLQGLLLMPASSRPRKFDRWQPIWYTWERWLQDTGISPLEACLRYALSVMEVDRVVVGVDSVEHLHQILTVYDEALPSLPVWSSPIEIELIDPSCWSRL